MTQPAATTAVTVTTAAPADLLSGLDDALPNLRELYRDLRLYLHRELNAEPDAATRALFEQIRAEAREKAGARRLER